MDDQFIVVRGIGYGLYKTRILRVDILLRDLFQCLKPTFSKKIVPYYVNGIKLREQRCRCT